MWNAKFSLAWIDTRIGVET
jgi:hypothetical protein